MASSGPIDEGPIPPAPEGDHPEYVASEEVPTGTSQNGEEAAENAEEEQTRTTKEKEEGDGNQPCCV